MCHAGERERPNVSCWREGATQRVMLARGSDPTCHAGERERERPNVSCWREGATQRVMLARGSDPMCHAGCGKDTQKPSDHEEPFDPKAIFRR